MGNRGSTDTCDGATCVQRRRPSGYQTSMRDTRSENRRVRIPRTHSTPKSSKRVLSQSRFRSPKRRSPGDAPRFFKRAALRSIAHRIRRHWWKPALLNVGENVLPAGDPVVADEGSNTRDSYLRRLGICRLANVTNAAKAPLLRQLAPPPKFELLNETCDDARTERSNSSLECSEASGHNSFSSQATTTDSISIRTPDSIKGGGSLDDRARMKFLRKLSYEKAWIPKAHRPPSHQTLIIFDWDDTLACTTYLNDKYPGIPAWRLPECEKRMLKAIERADAKLLEMALSLGQTFIITNATYAWVESSACAWLPSLLPLLQKVKVVSARSRYEAEYPNDVSKWKAETFLEVRRQLDSQVITNLVSLGDSEYEMEATQAMGREFQQATTKLVKFTQYPTPYELLKQLEIVVTEFERIVGNATNHRIKLQRAR